MLNNADLPPDHPLNKLDPKFLVKQDPSYFGAKLDFRTRCAILALHMSGIPRVLLATAYNIDRRTVGHIVNDASPHYRAVRNEVKRLGEVEFLKVYVRDTDIARIQEHRHDEEAGQNKSIYEATRPQKRAEKVARPNRRANRCQGIHVIHTYDGDHRFELEWHVFDDISLGECWAYRDLDGDNKWYKQEGSAAYTSHQTLAGVVADNEYKPD